MDGNTLKYAWNLKEIPILQPCSLGSKLVALSYHEVSAYAGPSKVDATAFLYPASERAETLFTTAKLARLGVAPMLAVMNRGMILGGRHALMAKAAAKYIEGRPVATSLESEFARRVRQWDDKDLAPHTSPLAEDHLSAIREDIDRTLTALKAEGVGKLELSWRASKMHRHYSRLELSKR